MSFQHNVNYKDSGVDWLGQLPIEWKISKFRHVITIKKGGIPNQLLDTKNDLTGVPYLTMDYLRGSRENVKWVNSSSDIQLASDKDILLLWDGSNAGEFIMGMLGAVSSTMALLSTTFLHQKFFFYVCKSAETEIRYKTVGMGIPHVNSDHLKSLSIPLPTPREQSAIAIFLDHETAKIDSLIAEQQRLIELLKEKHQALISHAVTKGLNPDVSMKDSGVEWLGKIPKHWRLQRLKFLCDIQTGDKDTIDATEDGQYPFFVRSQTIERINSFTYDCEAVLTAGDGVGVGKVFHYYNGPFDFHQRVYMLNNFREISGRFIYHYLKENFYKVALEGGAKSTVDSLRMPLFLNFVIAVPSSTEQETIINVVESETAKIEELTTQAQQAIILLQERRTALISAAVTGKIDVRETPKKDVL